MSPTREPQQLTRMTRLLHFLLVFVLVFGSVVSLGSASPAFAAVVDAYPGDTLTVPRDETASTIGAFSRDAIETAGLTTCGAYPAPPTNTNSVWYTYTPAANGWLTVSTATGGTTNYDTVLQVWAGSVSAGTSVGCNDDVVPGNRSSELTLQVTGGTTNYITVRRNGTVALPGGPTLRFTAGFSTVREVFVNQTTGFDGNPGSSALPVRTIQKGLDILAAIPAGGRINFLDSSTYIEQITINRPIELNATAGAVSIDGVTLDNGANLTLTGSITSPSVRVNPGAQIAQGVALVASGGVVRLGDGTFSEAVTISKDNVTLRAVNEAQATMQGTITLNGNTITVTGLNLQGATGVLVSGGTGNTVTRNNITGNTTAGLTNDSGAVVVAERNWWGTNTGPTNAGNPSGTGSAVTGSGAVDFRPWCSEAIPTCGQELGAATKLQFRAATPSTTAVAGVPFAAQPIVEAVDEAGNIDPTVSGNVTLAIAPGGFTPAASGTVGAGPAAIGGTVSVPLTNGAATFSGLFLNLRGTYTLDASSGGLTPATSAPIVVTGGAATSLVLTSQPVPPTNYAAGATLPLAIEGRDQFGNVAEAFNGAVTAALSTNPTSTSLFGTTTGNAVAGVAAFPDLNIRTAGTGYQITVSDGSLSTPPTTAFNIDPATDNLFFIFTTQPPASVRSGQSFTAAIRVEDQFGNVATNFSGNVGLTLVAGPAATLTGGDPVAIVNGVATFPSLSVVTVGSGYRLGTTAVAGVTQGTSSPFDVIASGLEFSVQPPNPVVAGQTFSVQVRAIDALGAPITSFNGQVTLSLGGPSTTLGGTLTRTAVNGVADFPGLSIATAGDGYQITATPNTALIGAIQSNLFAVVAAAPTKIDFETQPPASVRSGAVFSVTLVLRDQFDNVATNINGGTVALSLSTNPAGGTLGGTPTGAFTSGRAILDISVDRAAAGYRLQATASGATPAFGPLTSPQSNAFAVTASQLVFATQPANTPAGQPIAFVVEARDITGAVDVNFTGRCVVVIDPSTGRGVPLLGTTFVDFVAGVCTFGPDQGLNITRAGTYRLIVATAGLPPVTSAPFDILAGPAARLLFRTTPGATRAEAVFANQPVVEARDQFGNVATSFTGNVVLALQSGTPGANLLPPASRTVAASAGVATFSGLSIDRVGIYTLGATTTVPSVTLGVSSPISITANRLVFSTSPQDSEVGRNLRPFPVVQAQDRFGGIDTTFTAPISITLTPNTGSSAATLRGIRTINTVAGSATFNNLWIDRLGSAYQLTAGTPGLPNAVSSSFSIIEAKNYMPFVLNPPLPDLVGTITLVPANPTSQAETIINVTITNRGKAPANNFWVDFYINPISPPTANDPWNELCAEPGTLSCQGIAWFVTTPVAPGQSITLTSQPKANVANGFEEEYSFWLGRLSRGQNRLYLYVDSWNRDPQGLERTPWASVYEPNEGNNRFQLDVNVSANPPTP